jgi:hypothetical protein
LTWLGVSATRGIFCAVAKAMSAWTTAVFATVLSATITSASTLPAALSSTFSTFACASVSSGTMLIPAALAASWASCTCRAEKRGSWSMPTLLALGIIALRAPSSGP